jgi:hypothetical protein
MGNEDYYIEFRMIEGKSKIIVKREFLDGGTIYEVASTFLAFLKACQYAEGSISEILKLENIEE